MIFNFYLGNHTQFGQTTLGDPRDMLICQLRACGHQAFSSDHIKLDSSLVNVLFEGFTDPISEQLEEAHDAGARFLIIATERPTETGFNGGISKEMANRQRAFPRAAATAEAIWTLIPGEDAVSWYGQHAPAASVELGYAPGLVGRVPGMPDCEYSFHGSITKRRRNVFRELSKRFFTPRAGAIASFAENAKRDETISRGKVVVQVRAFDSMGSVSSSRCSTALHIGRPVVAEPHELSHPWEEVIHFSETMERFYDDVVVKRIAWRSEWERQFERFKKVMSPQRCVGAAVTQTFGARAAAA